MQLTCHQFARICPVQRCALIYATFLLQRMHVDQPSCGCVCCRFDMFTEVTARVVVITRTRL